MPARNESRVPRPRIARDREIAGSGITDPARFVLFSSHFSSFWQVAHLWHKWPEDRKPVLAMGYFTGMREGEILPLRLDQLDIRESQVLLDPGTTKNDQPRIVPLTGELRAILEMQLDRHQHECPHCPFLFFYRGRKIGVFRKAWRNTCVRLGLGRFVCVHCGDPTVGTKKCASCSKLRK